MLCQVSPYPILQKWIVAQSQQNLAASPLALGARKTRGSSRGHEGHCKRTRSISIGWSTPQALVIGNETCAVYAETEDNSNLWLRKGTPPNFSEPVLLFQASTSASYGPWVLGDAMGLYNFDGMLLVLFSVWDTSGIKTLHYVVVYGDTVYPEINTGITGYDSDISFMSGWACSVTYGVPNLIHEPGDIRVLVLHCECPSRLLRMHFKIASTPAIFGRDPDYWVIYESPEHPGKFRLRWYKTVRGTLDGTWNCVNVDFDLKNSGSLWCPQLVMQDGKIILTYLIADVKPDEANGGCYGSAELELKPSNFRVIKDSPTNIFIPRSQKSFVYSDKIYNFTMTLAIESEWWHMAAVWHQGFLEPVWKSWMGSI